MKSYTLQQIIQKCLLLNVICKTATWQATHGDITDTTTAKIANIQQRLIIIFNSFFKFSTFSPLHNDNRKITPTINKASFTVGCKIKILKQKKRKECLIIFQFLHQFLLLLLLKSAAQYSSNKSYISGRRRVLINNNNNNLMTSNYYYYYYY